MVKKLKQIIPVVGKNGLRDGTSWFCVESGPTSTQEVREAFDDAFLNCVSQIVEDGSSYWVFVDMGRQCSLLEIADQQIKRDGWNVKYNVPIWQQGTF